MMRWRNCVAALAGFCSVSGCQPPKEGQPKQETAASDHAPAVPALPVAEPLLNREALLLAVSQAASGAALGKIDEAEQRRLEGKRFELRLRFGCQGPVKDDGRQPRAWSFDEKRRVLSLKIEPEIAVSLPLIHAIGGNDYEAVEGFWIHRPWLLEAACPAALATDENVDKSASTKSPSGVAIPPQPAPPPPRIGIAQFFSSADARTHRRDDRAYKTTKVLADGETPSMGGYDLVVTGRLRRLTDGRVIACKSSTTAAPPSCIISAQFESVAIDHPRTGETIAKWSMS